MLNFFNFWRYYGLGRDEYKSCIKTAFINNIAALRWANLVFFALAIFFSIFPVIIEKNFVKASYYVSSAFAAFLLFLVACYQDRQIQNEKHISKGFLMALILAYYANVMFFGLFLAVWAEPEKIAGSFIGIIICVLFLFNISSVLYLCLILITLAFYITAIITVKVPSVWNYDIQNAFFAGALSLIFGWQIIMNRLTMISKAKKLKDENTIDELTQLKNRRDFMSTFNRFLTNHRQSDRFLYVALLDIDCFKNYNDHYGHPQGDECLSTIGKALRSLHKKGIYTARVGGEEFALLWHTEHSSDAENIGLYVNQMIRDLNIPHEKSTVASYLTISIGIYVVQCGTSCDILELYSLADKALYAAKNNGRNCTVVRL